VQKKLERAFDPEGLAIIPLKLFTNERFGKLDIGLCRGRRTYDKRESLKEQDTKRDLDRIKIVLIFNHFLVQLFLLFGF
jgi:SsrA-binding protein